MERAYDGYLAELDAAVEGGWYDESRTDRYLLDERKELG
jgi:hypothetical protein